MAKLTTTPKTEFSVGDRISVQNKITLKEGYKATIVSLFLGTDKTINGMVLRDGYEKPNFNGLDTSVKI